MKPGEKDLWFLPLGGCGEIGLNLNLYGHNGHWIMVDCGIGFDRAASSTRIIRPSADFIAARRDQLSGLLITHAHEDHVGAVAYLWPQLRCPVFCSRFTFEILRSKLAEAQLEDQVPVHVVEARSRHRLGPFDIEWFDLTHSTPESQALMLRTPVGSVFHTGDWKLDRCPLVGRDYNEQLLRGLGEEGVLAMVCDSTSAMVEGHSASEGELHDNLLPKVLESPGRVVVTCFGSNIARLHTLARAARSADRYPAVMGRSLQKYITAARASGLWDPVREFIEADHLGYLPPAEVFAIVTGSQGEPNAALSRLAAGTHPVLELAAGDRVIFSARVIPGNEEAIGRLCARLGSLGVTVVQDDVAAPIHASGHPARDELRAMYSWIRPRIAVPVHGEPEHIRAHAELARQVGVPVQLQGLNGDLFRLAPQVGLRRNAAVTGAVVIER